MGKISADIREKLINYIIDYEDDFHGINKRDWRDYKKYGLRGYVDYDDADLVELAESYSNDEGGSMHIDELIDSAVACMKIDEIINSGE